MDAHLPSWTGRQRGAFAFLAILLLLVVVAVAIRLLLGSSQATTYGTSVAGQSVQAYLLGASGQERAVALLKSAIPNSIGKLDADVCSASTIGSGSYSLGNGSLAFTALTPTPAGCDGVVPNTCTGCDVQVTGTVASASRVLNLSVSYSSTAGVTGFGTTVTQRLKTTVAPSAAVFNLAYRRQMSNLAGGQATVTTCAGCNVRWDLESSSGSPSVGGQAVYDSLATAGTFTVTQTLSDARNYAEVGLLFKPASGATFGLTGSYAEDKGGTGKTTTGTSNTVTGEVTNGAINELDWCRGGLMGTEPPFADTLIFGFSGRSTTTADALTAVTFNCEDPSNPAKCANPVPLTPQQRQESYAGDMYSEFWVATNPDYTATAVGNFPIGATMIEVSNTTGLVPGIKPLVAVKSGSGEFQPGTIIDSFITSPIHQIVLNKGLRKAISNGNVICGGTCAFFDHTTNGNTSFLIAKSAGTTQWAAGFMCLKGVGDVAPIFQGTAKPVVWYEPF